jgi:hypothetical protein
VTTDLKMAVPEKRPVSACLRQLKWHRRNKARKLKEEEIISQLTGNERAALLTQKHDLIELIATCTDWNSVILDLPAAIPKRKDKCWMFCSDMASELQGLRRELLKLQQDVATLHLREIEVRSLGEVVHFVHQKVLKMPNLDSILADREFLARESIGLWHRSRIKKHALAFGTAAQCSQAAREQVQKFRTSLAVDHGYMDVVAEQALGGPKVAVCSSGVIQPVKMKRSWLPQRISTTFSTLNRSAFWLLIRHRYKL